MEENILVAGEMANFNTTRSLKKIAIQIQQKIFLLKMDI